MADGNGETLPSQILITFKDEKSIEFDIKLMNVAVSQMILAAKWLEIKSSIMIEAAERQRRDRLAQLNKSEARILLPGMKAIRGD